MAEYLELARQVREFSLRAFGYLPDGARRCEEAPFLSFRRSDAEPEWADLWYVATQLGADAALLRPDPGLDRCSLEGAARFVDLLAEPSGGYLARATLDLSTRLGPDRYTDDHGHLGLTLLDAYEATGEPAHLARARRAADYLLQGGLWDDTFGGGFWWNSRRGDSAEGKPAQANGLAADLFLRLYGQTGERRYRQAAERTLDWLDGVLFDPAAGLYRWSVAYQDPVRRRGRVLAERYFNYDQGIVIGACCSWLRCVGPSQTHLARARGLAERLEPRFWQPRWGGFQLEAGVEQVFAIYSAWLTPALLDLARFDPDPRWPELARRNVEALHSYLAAGDGGYFRSARLEAGAWRIDRTRDAVANAGLQWALARLALAESETAAGCC